MKRLLALLLMGVMLLGGCAQTTTDDTIKIGVLLAFSGAASDWAQKERQAIELAIEDLNGGDLLGGRQVEVIYEDSALNPKSAVNGYNKLVNVDQVDAIVGAFGSGSTLAIAPLAQKDKIVILTCGHPFSNSPRLNPTLCF